MTDQAMPPDDPMRLSGAAWCAEHHRWECSATSRRSNDRCHGSAITGTKRCRMHSGRPAVVAKALGEANLAAWSTSVVDESAPLPDPGRVVLEQLRQSVMRADIYGGLLRWQLDADEMTGLVGEGERVRGLARLEAEERDRVVRFAKTAHDMGIADKEVEQTAAQAAQVTAAFRALMNLTFIQAHLPADRDLMVRTFLGGLGVQVEQLEAGGPA